MRGEYKIEIREKEKKRKREREKEKKRKKEKKKKRKSEKEKKRKREKEKKRKRERERERSAYFNLYLLDSTIVRANSMLVVVFFHFCLYIFLTYFVTVFHFIFLHVS